MEVIEKIQKFIMGYKTYAAILAALVLSILQKEGVVSDLRYEQYMEYVVAGGGLAFVAKINRWIALASPAAPVAGE